tara:strand:- start:2553 stop:3767 length:1215 start_codon:yes stop_codon:yes gene_type:complete
MICFKSLTPTVIGTMICEAKTRVIYSAPSLTDETASALISIYKVLGDQCLVVVDHDEQLFRLGYGQNEAITMLVEQGVPIRKQAGLRIGCLIIDEQGWVFSLSPMAVEAQETDSIVNAMSLGSDQIDQVITALAVNTSQELSRSQKQPELGQQALSVEEVKQVSKTITENPPQAFDLQRQVRVYQAHLQFVDIELEGGRIEQRTVRLPKEFKEALFANDKEIEQRLNANYKLINNQASAEFASLREEVKSLREIYAPSLGSRLGRVLLLARKKEFTTKVTDLQKRLDAYCKDALHSIQETIEQSLNDLAKNLAHAVKENPPKGLKGRCSNITNEIAEEYLRDILYKIAPSAKTLLAKTQLHCTFKDVTLEMLEDNEFQQKVLAEFPYEPWAKPFKQYSAAKGRT